MTNPTPPDPIDMAIAKSEERHPIQEAVAAAGPGGPNLGSGSVIRWTDDAGNMHEGAFAVFLPKDVTHEAAFMIHRVLGDILNTTATQAGATKRGGLVLVKGKLPPKQ